MRNKRSAETLIRLLTNARYEVLPTASTEDKVLEHLPRDRTITVTASPSKGWRPPSTWRSDWPGTGTSPYPTSRRGWSAAGRSSAEIADRLVGKGITRVFVPGGDAEPAGDYLDALALLEDLAALGRPFSHVGITGYPESHPSINDDLTVQSMWDKRRHATHIVSNLTFDAGGGPRLAAPAAGAWRHDAAAAGHPRTGRAHQAARHGDQDRRRRVDQVPRQEQGHVRPARRPRRLHRRDVPREVRARARRARRARRGPARLHVQPDRRDRGLAHRPGLLETACAG